MKKFGIPTTSIAAALLAASSAKANLPEANHALDLDPLAPITQEVPSNPAPNKPRMELITNMWEQYRGQVEKCVLPKGQKDQISIIQSPERGLEFDTECLELLEPTSNSFDEMRKTAEAIMNQIKMRCGYVTISQKTKGIQVETHDLKVAKNCEARLEKFFPIFSFSPDSEPELPESPEDYSLENCELSHDNKYLTEWCQKQKIRGSISN